MKQSQARKIVVVSLLLLGLVLVGAFGFTVVSISAVEQTEIEEAFDPVEYVDGIYESRILPTISEKAVELETILSEMEPDSDGKASKESLIAITEKYGLITVGEAHVYVVKGSGTVIDVNTDSSMGTMELLLDGYTGPISVLMYLGTRIPSDETSVRDAVGFIQFGDFREQTEYGKVAAEINKRILTEVLGNLDKENLMGKKITFMGAFNIRTFNLVQIDISEISIVPVEIVVGG